MNKKTKMTLWAVILIGFGSFFLMITSWRTSVAVHEASVLIEEKQELLSKAISLPRHVYEQVINYQPRFDAGVLPMFVIGVLLIFCGVFILFGELDYYEQMKARVHVSNGFFIAGLLLAVLMFSPSFPSVHALDTSPRWYASADIPRDITWYGYATSIDKAEANIQAQLNRLYSGFVAFYLGIGSSATKEWVAIGYYQNNTGYHLYADSYINGQYYLVIYGDASVGTTYNFNVTSVGSVANVWLNNVRKYGVTFSASSTILQYFVTSESTDTNNSLNITYTKTKVGFTTWDWESGWGYYYSYWPKALVTVTQDSPYTASLVTGSGVEAVVTSGGAPLSYGGAAKGLRSGGGDRKTFT